MFGLIVPASRGFLRLVTMAIKTYVEQLEEIQAAISSIVGGAQAHSINGRSMTKADLGVLYQMQKEVYPLAMAEQENRTGARVRYVEVG